MIMEFDKDRIIGKKSIIPKEKQCKKDESSQP
jgi:hypothetical protein